MTTKIKLFNLPLLSVGFKADKAVVSIGLMAQGIIAVGMFAKGIIVIAQFGLGVIVLGQFALGLFVINQIGVGVLFCLGQIGVSYCSIGAMPIGIFSAGIDPIGVRTWKVSSDGQFMNALLNMITQAYPFLSYFIKM